MATVKPGVSNKVSAALTELGISTHLVMPTKANIEKIDALQASLAQMVELKKAVDRIQSEIRMVKKKKDQLLGTEEEAEVKKEDEEARTDRETSIRVSCRLACFAMARDRSRVARMRLVVHLADVSRVCRPNEALRRRPPPPTSARGIELRWGWSNVARNM